MSQAEITHLKIVNASVSSLFVPVMIYIMDMKSGQMLNMKSPIYPLILHCYKKVLISSVYRDPKYLLVPSLALYICGLTTCLCTPLSLFFTAPSLSGMFCL